MNTATETTTGVAKLANTRNTPEIIAFVTYHNPPGQASTETTVETITAPTRTEMRKKLTDPMIAKIHRVVRGRFLDFGVGRTVNFF